MSKIEAHIRPNGHEGYIVEISAPHLGPARVPVKEYKPGDYAITSPRISMAVARAEAKSYRDGFNACVEIVAGAVSAMSAERR